MALKAPSLPWLCVIMWNKHPYILLKREIRLFWLVGYRLWPGGGGRPFELIFTKNTPKTLTRNTPENLTENTPGNLTKILLKIWPKILLKIWPKILLKIWPKIRLKICNQKSVSKFDLCPGANSRGDNGPCQGAQTRPTAHQVRLEKGEETSAYNIFLYTEKLSYEKISWQ